MTGTVFALHGLSTRAEPRKFVYRNIADEETLTRVLSSRHRFVPLADALAGRGDALTIDDGTRAAADAALLARRFGHAVSLFINPAHVDSARPYSFHLLNALLDQLAETVVFDGKRYWARWMTEKRRLRAQLKKSLRDTRSEDERTDAVRTLASEWSIGPLAVPSFLEPLNVADLRQLLENGVEIHNHGWSHSCHKRLTPDESAQEIERGREWLQSMLGVHSRVFVVPYGDVYPAAPALEACDVWLTRDPLRPSGPVSPGVWNRETL